MTVKTYSNCDRVPMVGDVAVILTSLQIGTVSSADSQIAWICGAWIAIDTLLYLGELGEYKSIQDFVAAEVILRGKDGHVLTDVSPVTEKVQYPRVHTSAFVLASGQPDIWTITNIKMVCSAHLFGKNYYDLCDFIGLSVRFINKALDYIVDYQHAKNKGNQLYEHGYGYLRDLLVWYKEANIVMPAGSLYANCGMNVLDMSLFLAMMKVLTPKQEIEFATELANAAKQAVENGDKHWGEVIARVLLATLAEGMPKDNHEMLWKTFDSIVKKGDI